jgi:hypothetical protein
MRLFELAAHVSGDVSWCTHIPADLLDPGSERKSSGPSVFERDRCILEIASNTRNPASCQLIPLRSDDWPGAMSRRSLCAAQAVRPRDQYYYGATRPPTDAEIGQLFLLLGYPLPDVHDVSANEIESACYYFIWRLADTALDKADSKKAAANPSPSDATGSVRANDAATDKPAAANLRSNHGVTGKPADVAGARAKFLARVAVLPNYP